MFRGIRTAVDYVSLVSPPRKGSVGEPGCLNEWQICGSLQWRRGSRLDAYFIKTTTLYDRDF